MRKRNFTIFQEIIAEDFFFFFKSLASERLLPQVSRYTIVIFVEKLLSFVRIRTIAEDLIEKLLFWVYTSTRWRKHRHIKQKVKDLGKFLCQARKECSEITDLQSCLVPNDTESAVEIAEVDIVLSDTGMAVEIAEAPERHTRLEFCFSS